MAETGENLRFSYETLADHYLRKRMEPFILSHPSDEALKHTFQPDGEEMLFVLQGRIWFE